jgi:hypothetical protein
MSQLFENVREQLLRAGIAPRHAGRYVCELREHLSDLIAQESNSGLSPSQAGERARSLLGSEDQLVEAMLARGVPRSMAARAPWSVFTLLPLCLFVLVIVATGILMMSMLWPIRGLPPSSIPPGYAVLITCVSFATTWLLGPLLASSCMFLALRQRVTSAWVWIGFGLIALVSGPLGFHMNEALSLNGDHGAAVFSMAGLVHSDGQLDVAATLGVAALRAAALFAIASLSYQRLRAKINLPPG